MGYIKSDSERGRTSQPDYLAQALVEPISLPVGFLKKGPREKINTVLLIDDEPDLNTMNEISVKHFGAARVLKAKDGREAMEILMREKDELDLIICDRRMPDLPGDDFSALARRVCPFTPMVMISAADRDRQFHADGYLLKPYNVTDLGREYRRLESLLRERSRMSPKEAYEYSKQVKAEGTIVDDSIMKAAGWDARLASEYLKSFRRRGLDPILTYIPTGNVAYTNGDGVTFVNLHKDSGPQHIIYEAREYVSAHEAMEMHNRGGRVSHDNNLNLPQLMTTNARLFGSLHPGRWVNEVAVDAAVTRHYGAKALSEGYCRLLDYDLGEYKAGDSTLDLGEIAYRQTVTRKQSMLEGLSGQMSSRLARISESFGRFVGEAIGEDTLVREYYASLLSEYGRIFDSVKVDSKAIGEYETTHGLKDLPPGLS